VFLGDLASNGEYKNSGKKRGEELDWIQDKPPFLN
jgi:hypothetical protein